MNKSHIEVRPGLVRRATVIGALVATLCACGRGPDGAGPQAGQAIVQVNGQDLTVRQLNYQLARTPGSARASDQMAAKRQAAEQLVNRELLLERATAQKLERDPAVKLALEEGRRQLLAQAHLERVMAQASAPTDEEIRTYYEAHPLKYAQRKLFLMHQVATDNTVPRADIEAYGKGNVTPEALLKWLQERGAKVRVAARTLAAERLPDSVLERLQTLQKGQAIMIGSATEVVVSFLADVRDAPLTLEQAKESIQQLMLRERRKALAEQEITRLREQAQIKWLGEFAAAPSTPVEAGAEPVPGNPADPEGAAPADDDKGLEQGLEGLR